MWANAGRVSGYNFRYSVMWDGVGKYLKFSSIV